MVDTANFGMLKLGITKPKTLMVEETVERSNDKWYVDRRYSLAFGEHKRTMAQLVDLFLDDEEKKIYQESANKNFEKAKIVHMLGLKMSCNQNASLINNSFMKMIKYKNFQVYIVPVLMFNKLLHVFWESRNVIAKYQFRRKGNRNIYM